MTTTTSEWIAGFLACKEMAAQAVEAAADRFDADRHVAEADALNATANDIRALSPAPPAPTQDIETLAAAENMAALDHAEFVHHGGGGEPDEDEVLAQARRWADGAFKPTDLVIAERGIEFARDLLSERARREAAERRRDEWREKYLDTARRAERAEREEQRLTGSALAEAKRVISAEDRAEAAERRLQQAEAALRNIGFGSCICDRAEIARAALEGRRTQGGEG